MNLREEMIAELYDLIGNNNLYAGMNKACDEAFDFFESKLNSADSCKAIAYLCEVDRNAFFTGARAMLDAITGKDVQ